MAGPAGRQPAPLPPYAVGSRLQGTRPPPFPRAHLATTQPPSGAHPACRFWPRFNLPRTWWWQVGQLAYPNADEILLLADCGGSNGYRIRLWKQQLQERFCSALGLAVRVCHYPPGASKWNPVEHRLFAFIARNWAAVPLDSYQTMLNYIRTTTTQCGLSVQARLNRQNYQRGIQISHAQM